MPLSMPVVEPSSVSIRSRPRWLDVSTFHDERGALGAVEAGDLPFDIQRLYYIYGMPENAVRGVHGHKSLEQLIICMAGSCTITFHNGDRPFDFVMDHPAKAVYVPPQTWRSIVFHEANSVLCVLASLPYQQDDYIYTFEEFLGYVNRSQPK